MSPPTSLSSSSLCSSKNRKQFKFVTVKQQNTLQIENHDDPNLEGRQRHGPLFPDTIRCLIIGPSNCGKTNLLLNLVEHKNGLRFENVYVYSKSLYQPKYVYLEKLLKPMKCIGYYAYSNNEKIIPPQKAKPNSIFIFDDISLENQDIVRQYFSQGRHNLVDSFYLCQTFVKIPKHYCRDNGNMLIVFKQDDLNLKHIYNQHINSDVSFDEFKTMCSFCWNKPYGFLAIFKDDPLNNGRYRMGLDHFIKIN